MAKYNQTEFKRINYEIFIWLLTFLSVFNILLILIFRGEVVASVIAKVNVMLSFVFFLDFLYRLQGAQSRRDYFVKKFGWLDLISSLPIPLAQLARLLRFIRTTRLFRESDEKRIVRQVISNRANTALLAIGFFVILLFEFGSIAILNAEMGAPNANITNANDAIWWVLATISTVGYGDYVPVTQNGRFVAVFVILAGVAVFGTLSGFLANAFLGEARTKEENILKLKTFLTETQQMQQQQVALQKQQQTEMDKLQQQLATMEELLHEVVANQKT